MRRHYRLLPIALLLLFAPLAVAAPRVSLITRPPGGMVGSAFGHSALRVDLDGDLATTTDQRVYEYGYWVFEEWETAFSKPDAFGDMVIGLLNGEMQASKRCLSKEGMQSKSEQLYPVGHEEVLQLTEQQLAALMANLAEHFEGEQGHYTYQHYTRNCATELRDRLFEVLDPSVKQELQQDASDVTSLRMALEQDLQDAIAIHGELGTVTDHEWNRFGKMLAMFGVPRQVGTSDGFFAMVATVTSRVSGGLPQAAERIAAARKTFDDTLDRSPLSRWDAAYTPARLRQLLLELELLQPRAAAATGNQLLSASHDTVAAAPFVTIRQTVEQTVTRPGQDPLPSVQTSLIEIDADAGLIRMQAEAAGQSMIVVRRGDRVAMKIGDGAWDVPKGPYAKMGEQLAQPFACPLPDPDAPEGPQWGLRATAWIAGRTVHVVDTVGESAVRYATHQMEKGLAGAFADPAQRPAVRVLSYHSRHWIEAGTLERLKVVQHNQVELRFPALDAGGAMRLVARTSAEYSYGPVTIDVPPEARAILYPAGE